MLYHNKIKIKIKKKKKKTLFTIILKKYLKKQISKITNFTDELVASLPICNNRSTGSEIMATAFVRYSIQVENEHIRFVKH